MEELLQQLIKKMRYECEDAHRQFVAAMNGLAGLHLLQDEVGVWWARKGWCILSIVYDVFEECVLTVVCGMLVEWVRVAWRLKWESGNHQAKVDIMILFVVNGTNDGTAEAAGYL